MEPTDELADDWAAVLRREAAGYARVALDNIGREFPTVARHLMTGPDDLPRRPRELTPVFYGSFDWHSCVEMHWLLVRLLRVAGDVVAAAEIRSALDAQFAEAGLAAEAAMIASGNGGFQFPYGWSWALALVHETATWDDPDARRWASALAPLADAISDQYLLRLAKETYPVRHGMHPNSAFGMSRALPYALDRAGKGNTDLAAAITDKARGWFGADIEYPGGYEPSGHDFLSPALAEAELMAQILPGEQFSDWLGAFLPGIAVGPGCAVHPGVGLRLQRRPDRAPARAERQPRLVLAAVGREPAGWRSPDRPGACGGEAACGGGAAARGRRRLHGRALARRLRRAAPELPMITRRSVAQLNRRRA